MRAIFMFFLLIGAGWNIVHAELTPQVVSSGDPHWAFADLEHNSTGTYRLLYLYDNTLVLKTFDGSTWSTQMILQSNALGFRSLGEAFDLAIDADDTMHLAFTGCSSATAESCAPYYVRYTEAWSAPVRILTTENPPKSLHMLIGGDGTVKVSCVYTDYAHRDILAYTTGTTTFPAAGTVIATTQATGTDEIVNHWLGTDGDGNDVVFYVREDTQNDNAGNLYLARSNDGFTAQTLLVDGASSGQAYLYNDAFLAPDGAYHVNYTVVEPDASAAQMYYLSDAAGSPVTQPIGAPDRIEQGRFGYGGGVLSMLVSKSGLDYAPQDLYIMAYRSGTWQTEVQSGVSDFTPSTEVYASASADSKVAVYENALLDTTKSLSGTAAPVSNNRIIPILLFLLQ